eukprot:4820822-Pyramimonas_sp.AAC.1
MTSAAVLRWWRLVPLETELTIRRLRYWQSLSRAPLANQQVLTALFGHFEVSQPVVTPEKRLSRWASPWA